MKLKKVHVREFQSINDSNEFETNEITCLVGKNEAGKTALLQALYRLNPIIKGEGTYSVTDDYPRRDVEDYQIDVENGKRNPAVVASATFELDDDDVAKVSETFGDDAIKDRSLTIRKGYAIAVNFDLQVDVTSALKYAINQKQFTPELKSKLEGCKTLENMLQILGEDEQTEPVTQFTTFLQGIQKRKTHPNYIFHSILWPRVPKFLYFDEYYQMKGQAQIEALKQRQADGNLLPSDHPLLGLINLARLNLDQLLEPARTRELKNKLEGAGNHLTKSVVKYWSQNSYLQLRFDVRPGRPEDPEDMRGGTNIWGDVYDTKHMVTTEMGTRSRGFVWFFSFLAWYSDVKRQNAPVILLLDEPGLSLHAKAQEDLLLYFESEIKGNHQLIYTTHSPFMVDPGHFDRIRIVQDLNVETDEELPPEKQGTKVLTDVLEATSDSIFPLQGALGYEIHQTLFIGPNSLVVEGPSDLLYLQAMSAFLEKNGRTGLDPQWVITPVGGSDKVPTFVALIGTQTSLNIAVLIDFQKKDRQTIENLYKKRLLEKKKVLTFADFVTADEADIEDMFDLDLYLKLVNAEFENSLSKPIPLAEISSKHHPRILVRLEEYFESNPLQGGINFNHYRPARYFSENFGALENEISGGALDRFEDAFKRLNDLL